MTTTSFIAAQWFDNSSELKPSPRCSTQKNAATAWPHVPSSGTPLDQTAATATLPSVPGWFSNCSKLQVPRQLHTLRSKRRRLNSKSHETSGDKRHLLGRNTTRHPQRTEALSSQPLFWRKLPLIDRPFPPKRECLARIGNTPNSQ